MDDSAEFQLAHVVGAAVFAIGLALVSVARCSYGTWNPWEAHRRRLQLERLRDVRWPGQRAWGPQTQLT